MQHVFLAAHQFLVCIRQVKTANVITEGKTSSVSSFSLMIEQPLGNIYFSNVYSELETLGT